MAQQVREPCFLPLTMSTVAATRDAGVVRDSARRADSAAAECWAALLAGCDAPGRKVLPTRLRELSEATSHYAGTRWWFGAGSLHRRRVCDAQLRIEEAVAERDGADFAEAFVGYDQAVATALVRAQATMENSAR